jgi:two-component system chemotaxis sensor kinase CheA
MALERQLVRRADVERMTDADWLSMIFVRGLSTADAITALSGRGVGMDIVKTNIERIGGTVEVRSEVGRGTSFILRLPLTLAIVPALIVVHNGERYAIPRASIQELLQLRAGSTLPLVEWVGRLPFHRLRHRMLSLIRLSDVLRAEGDAPSDVGELAHATELQVVVVNAEGYAFGLVVDAILDAEEIVVKPLEDPFKNMPALAGATLLGDGRVALILDMSGIGRSLHMECDTTRSAELSPPVEALPHVRSSALLVQARCDWRVAVPCGAVTRLEEIALTAVQRARAGNVVQYRGRIMRLVDLAALLEPQVPPEAPGGSKVPVLVVERNGQVLGLAVHAILDIIEEPPSLEPVQGRPGILGTSILDGEVTDHLDPDAALALAARQLELVPAAGQQEAA